MKRGLRSYLTDTDDYWKIYNYEETQENPYAALRGEAKKTTVGSGVPKLTDYESIDILMDYGPEGWEVLYAAYIAGHDLFYDIRSAFDARIVKDPAFLDFIQGKSLLRGLWGAAAIYLLQENDKTSYINITTIGNSAAGELMYIKQQLLSRSSLPENEEILTQCISDIDWMVHNLWGNKFPVGSIVKIMYQAYSFISRLDSMFSTLDRANAVANNPNSGVGATHSSKSYGAELEREMYSEMQLRRREFKDIEFNNEALKGLFVSGFNNVRRLYNFNLSINRSKDLEQSIILTLNSLDAAKANFTKFGGSGELWNYITRQYNVIRNMQQNKSFLAPSEDEYKKFEAALTLVGAEYAVISFALSNFVMKKFAEEHYVAANVIKDFSKYKKTCNEYYNRSVELLKTSNGKINLLSEGLQEMAAEKDYKYVVEQYYNCYETADTLNTIVDVLLTIVEFAFDVILTIGSIYAGGILGRVTGSALKWAVKDVVITELGALTAETFGFTAVSRSFSQITQLVKTGNPELATTFGQDFGKNILMFTALKGSAGGYASLFGNSKTLSNMAGAFIVEVGTLTAFETAWIAWENRALPPEDQYEVFTWEQLGRSAVFIFCLKTAMVGIQNHYEPLKRYAGESKIKSIQDVIKDINADLQAQRNRQGMETSTELNELRKNTKKLVDKYLEAYRIAQQNTSIIKDKEAISSIIETLEGIKNDLNRTESNVFGKYNIKPTGSKNLFTFETKEIESFKRDIVSFKGSKEKTGEFYRRSQFGDMYVYQPNGGGEPVYFRHLVEKNYTPAFSSVVKDLFGGETKIEGKKPERFIKDRFKEDYEEAGFKYDASFENDAGFQKLLIEAVERGWNPRYKYTYTEPLAEEVMQKTQKFYASERIKWMEKDFKARSKVKPQPLPAFETMETLAANLTKSQLTQLAESLAPNTRTLAEQYEYIVERISNIGKISQTSFTPDYIQVSKTEGKPQYLIWEARNIGDTLSEFLKDDIAIASGFQSTVLSITDLPLRDKMIKRMESTGSGAAKTVIPQVNELMKELAPEENTLMATVLSEVRDNKDYTSFIETRKLMPATSPASELIFTVYQKQINQVVSKLPEIDRKSLRKADLMNEQKIGEAIYQMGVTRAETVKPIKSQRNHISQTEKAVPLPGGQQFGGQHFFFHPDLNMLIKAKVDSKQQTREFYIELHEKYGQGILLNNSGIPDVSPITYKESGGKLELGAAAQGEPIIVDLGDPVMLKNVKLDKKINGLTPVKHSHQYEAKQKVNGRDENLAEKAFEKDVKNANKVMKKRWEANGLGEWKQPEDSAWYFEPGTHKMILVEKNALIGLGYQPEQRYTDIDQLPKSYEIHKIDGTLPETLTIPEQGIIHYSGSRTFRIKNGKYEKWNGIEWEEISKEKYETEVQTNEETQTSDTITEDKVSTEEIALLFESPYLQQAREQYINRKLAEAFPELTIEEGVAIYHYTHGGDRINKELRTNPLIDDNNLIYERLLNQALSKLEIYEGLVYRKSDYISFSVDAKEYVEEGFLSTTKIQEQTRGFGKKYTFMIISKTGRKIDKLSQHRKESEVLFKSGTKFKIERIKETGDGYFIKMREI